MFNSLKMICLLIYAFKKDIQLNWPTIIAKMMLKEKRLPNYHLPFVVLHSRVSKYYGINVERACKSHAPIK